MPVRFALKLFIQIHFSQLAKFHWVPLLTDVMVAVYAVLMVSRHLKNRMLMLEGFSLLFALQICNRLLVHWFYWVVFRLWPQSTFFLMAGPKPRESLWWCDITDTVIPQCQEEFLIPFPGPVWAGSHPWGCGIPISVTNSKLWTPVPSLCCQSQLCTVLIQVWPVWLFLSLSFPTTRISLCLGSSSFSWWPSFFCYL